MDLRSVFSDEPEVLQALEMREQTQLLKALLEKDPPKQSLEGIELIKGEKGEKGDTPTEEELLYLIEPLIPDPIPGINGKDGYTPIKGIDYGDGVKGKDGKDGVKGKDGSPDSPKEIALKLNTLEGGIDSSVIKGLPKEFDVKELKQGGKHQLELKDIKGARLDMGDQRWHGGGLSTVSHDTTLSGTGTPSSPLSVVSAASIIYNDTVSGTVDGVNTVFTVVHPITYPITLFLANSAYQATVDYTFSGTTITFITAPDATLSGQPFWLAHV